MSVPNLIVSLEELKRVHLFLKAINVADLSNIDWYQDGKKKSLPVGYIEDFKFIGLSNYYFALHTFEFLEYDNYDYSK